MRKDDSFAECLSVFERLRGKDEAAVSVPKVPGYHQERPPANRYGDFRGLTYKPAQQAIENRAANNFREIPVAAGKGSRIVNLRRPNQLTFVNRCEVLHVEGMGRVHIPIAIGDVAKESAADIVLRIFSKEKGKWKQRLSTIEEKDVAMALGDGIGSQPGKRRDTPTARAGNMFADSIDSVAPAVEWTLNAFVHNMATAEVGAHVSAVCVHHCKFPTRGSKSDQLASQDLLRNRVPLHICTGPEQVPARRIVGKLICRGWVTSAN